MAAKMLLEASDGASDYGNKFGEPLIGGFCRSFGMDVRCTHIDDYQKDTNVENILNILNQLCIVLVLERYHMKLYINKKEKRNVNI